MAAIVLGGALGTPARFAATSDREAMAIYASTDDSANWQVRYADDR